jgi:glycosyltransferase involved in cell wall biosynthesis
MKILYHHRTLAKDGMDVHIKEMVAALRQRGHQVLVVGPGESDSPTTGTDRTIRRMLPTAVSEFAELAYNVLAFRRLQRAYASFQPDVLYERYNLFLLAGMRLSQMHGLPMLLEVNSPLAHERSKHGSLTWRRLAHRLEAKVWTGADAVLPVSHALADIILGAGVAEYRIHVIPNGVDPRRFSPDIEGVEARCELGLGNHVVLGFTGFVRPWHGLDRVIDVMANYGPAQTLHLLVVGDGPAKADLEHMANRLGVADRVRFVGPIDRARIPRYMAAFDIALQPSAVAYACPLKLIEYMAMGKAIVAPDQPNIRELIKNTNTGLLVRDGDTGELAEAIVSLATNAELRHSLGRGAAREVYKRGLTWEANAERVEVLADRLVRPLASPS